MNGLKNTRVEVEMEWDCSGNFNVAGMTLFVENKPEVLQEIAAFLKKCMCKENLKLFHSKRWNAGNNLGGCQWTKNNISCHINATGDTINVAVGRNFDDVHIITIQKGDVICVNAAGNITIHSNAKNYTQCLYRFS